MKFITSRDKLELDFNYRFTPLDFMIGLSFIKGQHITKQKEIYEMKFYLPFIQFYFDLLV